MLPAATTTPPGKHDHVDLVLDNGVILRLRDPRRFGAMLWAQSDVMQHALLAQLGPEPLTAAFTGTIALQADEGAARQH